jgi:signal transduction histidine kinase
VVIAIGDTGPGIPDDLLDQVFIPFFTTRATGSGVGLALSRQIMNAHGGDIVIERAEPGTRIRLLFG